MATFRVILKQGRSLLLNFAKRHEPACLISTSKKKKDGIGVTLDPMFPPESAVEEKSEKLKQLEKHFADTDPDKLKNWQSFGFYYTDRDMDHLCKAITMFFSITVLIVGGAFVIAYQPDHGLKDWSIREAYLELERRESLGLPLIDPNYVDPSTVILPTEEEIGDTDVVV